MNSELRIVAVWAAIGFVIGGLITPEHSGTNMFMIWVAMLGATIGYGLVLRLRWRREDRD
jgi:membrane protein DedA with SNARE-associated domain